MTTIQDVFTVFQLNSKEQAVLQACVELYAHPWDCAHLCSKTWEIAKNIFGLSIWDDTFCILEQHALTVLDNQFHMRESPQWEIKAHIVAEFILRYLITKESCKLHSNQYWIPYKEKLIKLNVIDLMDRAIESDGIHVTQFTSLILMKRLETELAALQSSYDTFKTMIKTNPTLNRLRRYHQIMQQQNISIPLEDQTNMQQAEKLIQDQEKFLQENRHLHGLSVEVLKALLHTIRQRHRNFKEQVVKLIQNLNA
jgi:hypothetical protein